MWHIVSKDRTPKDSIWNSFYALRFVCVICIVLGGEYPASRR